MRPLRVLYLSPVAPPPGGIESWMGHVLELAQDYGLEPTVINLRSPQPNRGPQLAAYKLRFGIERIRRCRSALAAERYDIVHLNCSFRRWSALRDLGFVMLARRRRVPVVVHLRGGLAGGREWSGFPAPARRAYSALLRNADSVVVLADEVERDLAPIGIPPERIVKLPNFLPPGWTEPHPPAPSERSGVLYTGRLMPEKGLGALVALAERRPELSFRWVGRRHGRIVAPRNVVWLGERPHSELRELYRRSRIFLFPTDYPEGFPNSVLEAMSASMPVVSTPRGAIPEMLGHGEGGFLHDPDDVEGMAGSLSRLSASDELCARLGDFNRRRVEEAYRAEEVLPRLRELYDRLKR